MASLGPNFPATAVGDESQGVFSEGFSNGLLWADPDNIKAADGSFATCTPGRNQTSAGLLGTNFGFAVPTGATINGVVAEFKVSVSSSGTPTITDAGAYLYIGGTLTGSGATNGSTWTTTPTYIQFGSPSDMSVWNLGTTLTAAQVNASGFGVGIGAIGSNNKGFNEAKIDACRITVYYTEAASGVTATPGVASLTTTRYAPSARTPRTATPGVKSLATTKYAPTVSTPRLATIGKLSLTATKYAPTVSTPRLSTPGVKSLALTLLAPVVSTPRTVTVGARSLSTVVLAPSIATPRTSTPSVASLSLAGFAPTVATPRTATPATASLTAAGYAPAVLVPRVTTPDVATLSLTSFAPVAATPRAVAPDAAAVAITSYTPSVLFATLTTPTTVTLTLTRYQPEVEGIVSLYPLTLPHAFAFGSRETLCEFSGRTASLVFRGKTHAHAFAFDSRTLTAAHAARSKSYALSE